jgi:very-short-patch-repair endonuclease
MSFGYGDCFMKEMIEEVIASNQRLDDSAELRQNLPLRLRNVPSQKLEQAYQEIVRVLKLRQIIPNQGEFIRTASERLFERIWKQETNIKIYSSMVIGRSPVDFFTPAIKEGIVFELDGEIHQEELKNRKDNRHEEQLKSLGVSVMRIENDETHELRTRKCIRHLTGQRLTDSRKRRRIFRRIYIETIGTWLSERVINQLFQEDAARGQA